MSKLEELINEFCPDGVEYRELWSITTWDKRFNSVERKKQPHVISYPYLLAADLFKLTQSEGDVFLLSTGEKTGWTTEELAADYLCEGEVVSIPWGKSRPVKEVLKYYKGKFVTADNRIATSNDTTKLLNKYLYYWMLTNSEIIDGFYRGSGITHPSMNDVLNLKVPLPPLPVQEEIVRILDNFTELTAKLTAELTAELTARNKQYAYYRDRLLENNDYPCKQLGELCKFVRGPFGGALKKECFQEEGFAVYEQQHAISRNFEFRYYISEDKFDELQRFEVFPNDMIMSCSGTMGKIAIIPPNAPRGIINQALLKLTANDDVDVKYLKYCFESTITKQMNNNARGGAIKNVASVDVLKKIEVKLPPLTEQQRIVDILDRFDTLCNDISRGLPAEIKARQQQYEYYRDKLLTFPKAK